MTPETLELTRTLLRHQLGIVTSVERCLLSPEFSRDEAVEVLGYFRKVLDAYERALIPPAVRRKSV